MPVVYDRLQDLSDVSGTLVSGAAPVWGGSGFVLTVLGSAAYQSASAFDASGAASAAQAAAVQRGNHTGTQAAGTITGLATSATTDATNATNISSGTLAVARGGTGLASYSAGNVIYATASTTLAQATPDAAGLVDKASTQTITGPKTVYPSTGGSTIALKVRKPASGQTGHIFAVTASDDNPIFWVATNNDIGVAAFANFVVSQLTSGSSTRLLSYILQSINRPGASAEVVHEFTINQGSSGDHMRLNAYSSTSTKRDQLSVAATWTDATDATRKARVVYGVYDTAFREVMRFEADGSAARCGFLGASAVVRQTVPAAATDAATTQALANSLRTALINFGLAV